MQIKEEPHDGDIEIKLGFTVIESYASLIHQCVHHIFRYKGIVERSLIRQTEYKHHIFFFFRFQAQIVDFIGIPEQIRKQTCALILYPVRAVS